jgi:hypothetical protein
MDDIVLHYETAGRIAYVIQRANISGSIGLLSMEIKILAVDQYV